MNNEPVRYRLDGQVRAPRVMEQASTTEQIEHCVATRMRAWALLWRFLSTEQRRDLLRCRQFEVIGSDARRYRLAATTRRFNVYDVAANGRYCAGPQNVPMGDFLLAQKLWLEADAPRFLRIAHRVGAPPVAPDAAPRQPEVSMPLRTRIAFGRGLDRHMRLAFPVTDGGSTASRSESSILLRPTDRDRGT